MMCGTTVSDYGNFNHRKGTETTVVIKQSRRTIAQGFILEVGDACSPNVRRIYWVSGRKWMVEDIGGSSFYGFLVAVLTCRWFAGLLSLPPRGLHFARCYKNFPR
jgi:hypothetical protein